MLLRDETYVAEHDRFETAHEAEEWLKPLLEVPVDAERPVDFDYDDYREAA